MHIWGNERWLLEQGSSRQVKEAEVSWGARQASSQVETEKEPLRVLNLISGYRKVSEALNADQNKHGCNTEF